MIARRLLPIQEVLPHVKRLAFLGSSRDPAARGFANASAAAGHEAVLVQPIFVYQRETVAELDAFARAGEVIQ